MKLKSVCGTALLAASFAVAAQQDFSDVEVVATPLRGGLELADAQTIVVPGHGSVSNRAELADYRAMLVDVRDRIAALKAQGKTLEEVVDARPTARYDERFGKGFISPESLAGFIYRSL